jgi:hypothetical protein
VHRFSGLLWWGEAAAVEGAGSELLKDWGVAVDEVCAVLEEVVKVVGNGYVNLRDTYERV